MFQIAKMLILDFDVRSFVRPITTSFILPNLTIDVSSWQGQGLL